MQTDTPMIGPAGDAAAESLWVTTGNPSVHGSSLDWLQRNFAAVKYAPALSEEALGSLLRPQPRPILKRSFSTMLNDGQLLQDHGLQVAGHFDAEQWLVPASLEEASPYVQPVAARWTGAFDERITALREAAVEERITICDQSLVFARAAIDRLHRAVRPSIFLLDNGNIRFVWHGEAGAQVGCNFWRAGESSL